MAWTGDNSVLNQHSPKNYMYGDTVFILDEITDDNCAYLIGDLTFFVMNQENQGKVLTFIINSPGGSVYTMLNIIGLMNVARINNIEIITFVMGCAASAASVLAVQGDKRMMNNVSRHFIHFGTMWSVTEKQSEIEKIYTQTKDLSERLNNLYLESCNGKLTKSVLLDLQKDERGYLTAEQCMQYGLCDAIIEDDLVQKRKNDADREEFEETFASYQKNKNKIIKKPIKKPILKSKKKK